MARYVDVVAVPGTGFIRNLRELGKVITGHEPVIIHLTHYDPDGAVHFIGSRFNSAYQRGYIPWVVADQYAEATKPARDAFDEWAAARNTIIVRVHDATWALVNRES